MAPNSAMTASRRLLSELAKYATEPNPALAELGPIDDDDMLHWHAVLLGPPGSPYEGGRWKIGRASCRERV